jgi:hypothetical protein
MNTRDNDGPSLEDFESAVILPEIELGDLTQMKEGQEEEERILDPLEK